MQTIKTIAAALVVALMLTGCASFGGPNDAVGRIAVQYATLKVIEDSDRIAKVDVLEHVGRVRLMLDPDDEVVLVDIREEIMSRIDMEGLDAADRLLVLALLDQVEQTIRVDVGTGIMDEDQKARVHEVLDWIESAARMAE